MPLDPKRVQSIFLEAANYHELADRIAILDRECMGDSELSQRVEALLKVHDRFNELPTSRSLDQTARLHGYTRCRMAIFDLRAMN
jgi:hypothetical protein